MATRYVPATLCVTKSQVDAIIQNMNEHDEVPLELIVMVDYAYHSSDADYDGGLAFFDRLHYKLSLFFPIQWTPEELKNRLRNAPDDYISVLRSILDKEKIEVYGV